MRTTVLSIDPGLGGTGIAVWDRYSWSASIVRGPTTSFNVFDKSRSDNLSDRIDNILGQFYTLLSSASEVHMEYPEYFDDLGGNRTAKRGDLVKLTFVAGAIFGCCYSCGVKVKLYKPTTWKGQLTKDQVEIKIRHILEGKCDLSGVKSHSWDAIGIGLFGQGKFHR